MLIAGFAVFIMLAGIGVVGVHLLLDERGAAGRRSPAAVHHRLRDRPARRPSPGSATEPALVTIDQIPEHVQHAVAAAEDRNFYRHSGVDYKGIARAAWNNVTGGDKQGASTITQQYARNAFENLKDDTYGRKVQGGDPRLQAERQYDKTQIMEHYLNMIYFGRGAYGIEAAAQTYFGKSASRS